MSKHMLKMGILTAMLLTLMGATFLSKPVIASPATVTITVEKHTGITIDGMIGDWAGISGTTITLIKPLAPTERIVDGLELRIAYDDSNIYMLVLITDDYDYNATDHHKSGAIAVQFAMDEAATPAMGGGLGFVDMWHWELDVEPGVVAGFNLSSGNDPVGNLDDEYANSTTNRHDDTLANEIYGAWSHTNMSAVGAAGKWIFEFKRALTTSDTLKQDRQFEIGQTYKTAIAYWDADETVDGWTASGHYSTCTDPDTLNFDVWIEMTLKSPTPTASEADLQDVNSTANNALTNANNALTDASQAEEDAHEALVAAQNATTMAYVAIALAVVISGVAIGISFRKR